MSSHEGNILNDPIVWYTLSLVVFLGGLVFKARKPIAGMLDAEIAKVRSELDQARKLRAEAEASLAEYEARQKEALAEAEAILSQARADAERLRTQAEEELRANLKTREAHAIMRIQQAEQSALDEVRTMVIDQAMAATRSALAKKIDAAADTRLVDEAIGSAEKLLDAKVA